MKALRFLLFLLVGIVKGVLNRSSNILGVLLIVNTKLLKIFLFIVVKYGFSLFYLGLYISIPTVLALLIYII